MPYLPDDASAAASPRPNPHATFGRRGERIAKCWNALIGSPCEARPMASSASITGRPTSAMQSR